MRPAQAISDSREDGLEEGIEKGILKTARAMKQNGITDDLIQKSTALTLEAIEKL